MPSTPRDDQGPASRTQRDESGADDVEKRAEEILPGRSNLEKGKTTVDSRGRTWIDGADGSDGR